ncbi:hypothetical protein CICLE_v10033030mg [Citrus x clementina]|uniref:Uncharacterized protein n=1 Tax=Citrus clementina TaxID=85681 RepID=V4STN9_CITCL|nr:hypothetical protein CICLE_v10033030mg [Citrus x clementina]
MGVDGGGGREKDKEKVKEKEREEEQDGMSVHSPCKAPPSSASSLPKEQSQVELELRLLEALEVYTVTLSFMVSWNFCEEDLTDTSLRMRFCSCWIGSTTWIC